MNPQIRPVYAARRRASQHLCATDPVSPGKRSSARWSRQWVVGGGGRRGRFGAGDARWLIGLIRTVYHVRAKRTGVLIKTLRSSDYDTPVDGICRIVFVSNFFRSHPRLLSAAHATYAPLAGVCVFFPPLTGGLGTAEVPVRRAETGRNGQFPVIYIPGNGRFSNVDFNLHAIHYLQEYVGVKNRVESISNGPIR